jgi:pyruvate dehydrogenase E1 component
MTNLGGHDLTGHIKAFEAAAQHDRPTCFIACTIKGYGLPFQGHKDNHASLMNPSQMSVWQEQMKVRAGQEWEKFGALTIPEEEFAAAFKQIPFVQ